MDKDFFYNSHTENTKNTSDEMNFFLNSDKSVTNVEHARRLNDYDYNILKEGAYKDVSDELFKLEYKISKVEDELTELDIQIQTAKDIRDFNLVEVLTNRKKILNDDLRSLTEIYNDTSLSAKISGNFTEKFQKYLDDIKQNISHFSYVLLSKLPGKFSSILEIKKSLSKLENINKNVDELMTMQTPYGEATDKYEQLSKYITRANNIQAEIARYLR